MKHQKQLKQNHDAIIEAMNTKQYFNWHNSCEGIDLDYKWQALSIMKSTKSKKIQALCLAQIQFYDKCFKNQEVAQ